MVSLVRMTLKTQKTKLVCRHQIKHPCNLYCNVTHFEILEMILAK